MTNVDGIVELLELDDVEFYCDYATAAERVDLGWFVMEKGTNAAVRAGWNGKIKGKFAPRGTYKITLKAVSSTSASAYDTATVDIS